MEVVSDNTNTKSCSSTLTISNTAITPLTSVTYSATSTYLLESITPRYGNVVGGQDIVFASSDITGSETIRIWLEGIECTTVTVTAGQATCNSAARLNAPADADALRILVDGKGDMSLNDLTFLYVSYWSEASTWGNDF